MNKALDKAKSLAEGVCFIRISRCFAMRWQFNEATRKAWKRPHRRFNILGVSLAHFGGYLILKTYQFQILAAARRRVPKGVETAIQAYLTVLLRKHKRDRKLLYLRTWQSLSLTPRRILKQERWMCCLTFEWNDQRASLTLLHAC